MRPVVRLTVLAVLMVAALGATRLAPAQSKVTEVLIGSVLPLTGTFANYEQQYLWSAQTAEDIVNNDYADIQVPLRPGKGTPASAARPSSSSCATTRAAASRRARSSSSSSP